MIKEVEVKRYQAIDGDRFLGEYSTSHEAIATLILDAIGAEKSSNHKNFIYNLINSPKAMNLAKEYTNG